jgi:K+-sensing histidine kinase KdpD
MTETAQQSGNGIPVRQAASGAVRARHYGAAVLLSAAALLLVDLLAPMAGVLQLLPLAAVVLSALYGGIGPGLVATGLSAAGYAYFFFEPVHSFAVANRGDASRLALLVAVSLLLSLVSGFLRSNLRRLRQEHLRAQTDAIHRAQLLGAERVARDRAEEAWAVARTAEIQARRVAERLSLSQSVTADLATALTQTDVARVMLEKGLAAFGAKGASMSVPVTPDELDVVQSVGLSPEGAGTWSRVRVDSHTPRAESFRTRQPIWLESPQEIERRYPHLATHAREAGVGAWAIIPLFVTQRPVGVFTLRFSDPHRFEEEERRFIVFLGEKYGQALERAQLYEADRSARAAAESASLRAGLLSSLGAKLSAGRDLSEVLSAASNGARAVLGGDDAALCLAEPDGRHLRGAFEIGPTGRVDALLDLDQLPHSRQAVEKRGPIYFSRAEAAGEEPDWFARLGIQGALVAPLVSEDCCIGVLYVDYAQDRFTRSNEDFAFVHAVAGLCALALGRAQVYEAERDSRRRAEAAEKEAKRIGDLQERLVAVVSHDLRNPLASITMGIDTLRKRRHLEPWEERVLARQARSAQRMEEIIRDLLDFAKARRGGVIPVRPEPMKMEEVCRRVIAELEQANPGREVSLHVEGDDRGEWDAARLAQLISNLVGNALQHSPEGAAVEVRIRGSSRNLVMEVNNSGPAIPPEVLPVLFEPFKRGSERKGKGVGLGLFIAREIARAHGGVVDVCSRADKGTSFTVKLPRTPRGRTA